MVPGGMPINGEVKNSNGLVSMLPFMEQINLFSRFDYSQAFSSHNDGGGTLVG